MPTQSAEEKTGSAITQDAFLGGKIEILQPAAGGHRAGLDAILLAAALPKTISGTLADLGAGAGTAGLAAIATRPELKVLLVENNPQMVNLATKTIQLAKNSAFRTRADVLQADITLSGAARDRAGLSANSFDFVIMNPPYNDASTNRSSSDPTRAEAHVMGDGGLDAWMRTATSVLKPRGMLVMIYRAQSIGQIIAATQGRFGGLMIRPVYPYANEHAKLLLIRATKGSRTPLSFVPPLVLHNSDGGYTTRANEILNGEAFLD